MDKPISLMLLTQKLYEFDNELTVYAKKPWTTESLCILDFEPKNQLVPSELSKEGYDYFLEIFVAKEIIPNLKGIPPSLSLEGHCEYLISYAENDC